ncbi:hypothetical protein RHMOL_Rhmol08G0134500 [Rhododendron molle]|uniref:Uncharacterized protein n=1 Tax=Rhododendron molle TaxID=49168 RepID=A0ACC0MMV1_RHOML|nr:hypothetical protein RHMOL_Rhmol08G0134500 [Rhododendron molle]
MLGVYISRDIHATLLHILGSVFPDKSIGSHGLLQQGDSKYDVKRRELAEYYHPLEFNPTIPLDEKAKLMEEWRERFLYLYFLQGLQISLKRHAPRMMKCLKLASENDEVLEIGLKE